RNLRAARSTKGRRGPSRRGLRRASMKLSPSELMSIAIAEGEKARLHAPPNPWVGALIVNDRGVIMSERHTQAPGESHAEIAALRRAGDAARGATMVVTLEPCAHV